MRRALVAALVAAGLAVAMPAHAQLSGNLLRGQYGLASGTQAPEGLVVTPFLYDYYTTQIVGPDGTPLPGTGSLNTFAAPGLNLWFVSSWNFLGASYGAVVSLWGTSVRSEFPTFNARQDTYGFGDMYVKPIELGWHTTYVDVITGFALWIPTGRYTPGGNDNTGLGQWGYEFSAGATVWFDQGHHLNFSSQAFYDLYSPKSGTIGPNDAKLQTGNVLSFQGGLGYQLLGGALNVGIPYFVQLKVTPDILPPGAGTVLPGVSEAKSWSIGLGAEADFYWSPTDGVVLRFTQSFAGNNVSNGSSYFFFYNHVFAFGS